MLILPSVILLMPSGDDRDYMEWLYRRHHRLMFSTARKVFQDEAAVSDAVSESCLALMKKISALREMQRDRLRAYIVTTVHNTALNLFERLRRDGLCAVDLESAASEADGSDVEKKILLREELEGVLRAICQLPLRQRQILRMKYLMEMSDREIAEALGLSADSVRKYVGRARARIKAIVYEEEGGEP